MLYIISPQLIFEKKLNVDRYFHLQSRIINATTSTKRYKFSAIRRENTEVYAMSSTKSCIQWNGNAT